MEEIKENSIHHSTLKICEYFQTSPSYQQVYQQIQKVVSSSTVKYDDFKNTLLKAMRESDLDSSLKNNVYHWLKTKKRETITSPFDQFFRKAQVQWDKRIYKSLNSMCMELGITLAKIRAASERQELVNKWKELSTFEVDIHKYRPVFAPKDFLEVILNLNGPITRPARAAKWEFSQMPLKVKNLADLRCFYLELSRGEQLLGANPASSSSPIYANLENERIYLGEKVLNKNYAPLAQEFLKKGSPQCLRAKIWTLILDAETKQYHYNYFESLKDQVLQFDLMMDKLIFKDINLTASNDDQYFVFEDVLHQIMLCFTRDSEILKNLSTQPGFMQVTIKGKHNSPESCIIFPPSGVIPFHGFTMYAAPFCYLFDDPVQLYFVFRTFYIRYFHRLHRLCSNSQGVVSLCLQFERLLQCFEPNLWHHFRKAHIHPIRIVIKWIMRAFSGYLPPEQLLNLWDLILAYDSLEIIPLLACAILIFRKDNLLKVNTLQNFESILADLSSFNVISLLQMSLLKE